MSNAKELLAPSTRAEALFLDLCQTLLTHNPSRRITAREALSHPFFRERIDYMDS